jgi:hypothetical protein
MFLGFFTELQLAGVLARVKVRRFSQKRYKLSAKTQPIFQFLV